MAVNRKAMFSRASDEWETPQRLFDELDKEFGFTLDACALPQNEKVAKYYTPEDDGLKQPWSGTVWCNPPYGREIAKWVAKAAAERALTVMLLPARTDTSWFHDYVLGKAEIRFLRGRLKFGTSKENAPFPNMIAVFRNQKEVDDFGYSFGTAAAQGERADCAEDG